MSKKKEQETFTTSGSLSSLTTEQKQELKKQVEIKPDSKFKLN